MLINILQNMDRKIQGMDLSYQKLEGITEHSYVKSREKMSTFKNSSFQSQLYQPKEGIQKESRPNNNAGTKTDGASTQVRNTNKVGNKKEAEDAQKKVTASEDHPEKTKKSGDAESRKKEKLKHTETLEQELNHIDALLLNEEQVDKKVLNDNIRKESVLVIENDESISQNTLLVDEQAQDVQDDTPMLAQSVDEVQVALANQNGQNFNNNEQENGHAQESEQEQVKTALLEEVGVERGAEQASHTKDAHEVESKVKIRGMVDNKSVNRSADEGRNQDDEGIVENKILSPLGKDTDSIEKGSQKVFAQLKSHGNKALVQQAKLILNGKDNGKGEIKIALHPKELGEIKMSFSIDNNRIVGKILVSSEIIKDTMQKNMEDLARQFNHEGYEVEGFFVSVDSNTSDNNSEGYLKKQFDQENVVNMEELANHLSIQEYVGLETKSIDFIA